MHYGRLAFDKSRGEAPPRACCGVVHRRPADKVMHSWGQLHDGARRRLSPFAVDLPVDKPWAECCSPCTTRPAGCCTVFVQGPGGYAPPRWMRLWISSGALSAAQNRRALARDGGFLYSLGRRTAEKSDSAAAFTLCTVRKLSTQGVDQGVDKLRAHRCRPRIAGLPEVWLNFAQCLGRGFFAGCPRWRGISLWISSGWIARPRRARALAGSGDFSSSRPGAACAQVAGISVWITLGHYPAGHGRRGLQGYAQETLNCAAGSARYPGCTPAGRPRYRRRPAAWPAPAARRRGGPPAAGPGSAPGTAGSPGWRRAGGGRRR